jgi:hypothetical protein
LPSGAGGDDLELIVQGELIAQRIAQFLVIVDQEDGTGRAHAGSFPGD